MEVWKIIQNKNSSIGNLYKAIADSSELEHPPNELVNAITSFLSDYKGMVAWIISQVQLEEESNYGRAMEGEVKDEVLCYLRDAIDLLEGV